MAPRTDALTRHKATPNAERISALGVIAPPEILVESPRFNGSLATLFSCVRDRKVDLLDVPLFPICEAYFAYLISAGGIDLDEAAAALAALAYLLERKAWLLLPSTEPEPESEEALELLAPSTPEYAAAIEALGAWREERERRFFRPLDASPEPYELPFELGDVSIDDLARALERVLKKAIPETITGLAKRRRSLSEEMRLVLGRLGKGFCELEALLPAAFTKADAVFGFLAILELIRLGQIVLRIEVGDIRFGPKGARK